MVGARQFVGEWVAAAAIELCVVPAAAGIGGLRGFGVVVICALCRGRHLVGVAPGGGLV